MTNPPKPPESTEVLSAEELAAIDDELIGAPPSVPGVRPLDLTDLGALTTRDAGLELIHEGFCSQLAPELERMARSEGRCHARNPRVTPFSDVLGDIRPPWGVLLLELTGLDTSALLLVDPVLLFHFVDLMMGGPGGGDGARELLASRSFTGTERRLMGRIVDRIASALREAWREITPVGARLVRAETDPRLTMIARPADRVVRLGTQLEWGEVRGALELVIPAAAMRAHQARIEELATGGAEAVEGNWRADLAGLLGDVEVELTAVLGRAEMPLRRVTNLVVGTTLRLDTDPEESIALQIEGIPRFRVKPTVHGGNVAITLVDIIEPSDSPSASAPGEE